MLRYIIAMNWDPYGNLMRMAGPAGDGVALYGNEAGLFLGPGIPLLTTKKDRNGNTQLAPRSKAELEHWLGLAYGGRVDLSDRLPILESVARAYNRGALVQALISAARLRLPPLDGAGLARLAKANFNIDEPRDWHGRWTTGGGGTGGNAGGARLWPTADEEEEPEEAFDPMAPLRQWQWDKGIALLRRLDPHDPNLSYVSVPGAVPDEAALAQLHIAIRDAAIRRIRNRVMPGGRMIGVPGTGSKIRELPGGINVARDLFDYLRLGGITYEPEPGVTVAKLPGDAGYVTFRPVSKSTFRMENKHDNGRNY